MSTVRPVQHRGAPDPCIGPVAWRIVSVAVWHDRRTRRHDGDQRARRTTRRPIDAGRRRSARALVLRDPAGPGRSRAARRVRDVGASRFVAERRVQRGPHRGHDRGDLPLPREPGHRRPAVHRGGSARPLRAGVPDRAPGPGRARRRRPRRCRRRLHADTGHLARDPRPQPRPPRPPCRRHRGDPVAQPARGRRLQVQPAQRRPGRHRRHQRDPGRGEPADRGSPRRCPPRPDRGGARPDHRPRLS